MSSIFRRQSNEISLLKRFKEDLKEYLSDEHNDEIILKYLRARSFVLERAELLFKQCLVLKQFFGKDRIIETFVAPEVARRHSFLGFLGFAKDGTPIRYIALGQADYLGFIKSMSFYDIALYAMYVIEKDLKALKNHDELLGTENNEITYIFDMEGFTLQKVAHKEVMEVAWESARLIQDYFPEIWKRVFFINVPSYFYIIYNIIKPIFKAMLLEKIIVPSSDSSASELLKYIDPEVLPVFLGGQKVDSTGDPKCSQFITFGGKVSEELYLCNSYRLEMEEPGVEFVLLRPRSFYNYSVVVPEKGSTLRIECKSETGSIGLAVLFKKFDPDSDNPNLPGTDETLDEKDPRSEIHQVIPDIKCQLHLAPIRSDFICPSSGIYILRFNNTFSWFQPKKVLVKCQVFPPTIQEEKITGKFPV